MSNYRNIEINLLPPELQPPPAVRTTLILNLAVILGVMAYIGLSTLSSFAQVRSQQEQIRAAEQEIKQREPIVKIYTTLNKVKESVDRYGRLVSLASVDYVDVPVLLDRLAKVIPAGVYLDSVSNDKSAPNARTTVVKVTLITTKQDPALVQATIDALKGDSIFQDCYLQEAEVQKESISGQLANYGVDWNASGPGVPTSLDVQKYAFVVMANVPKLLDTSSLPVVADKSIYLADVKFLTPPPPADQDAKGKGGSAGKAGARPAGKSEPAAEAANAPEGVKPVEVN
jgi:Tfp pilus assembly protein PilN